MTQIQRDESSRNGADRPSATGSDTGTRTARRRPRWLLQPAGTATDAETLFPLSAKKRQQVATFVELLGELKDERCLLLTHTPQFPDLHASLRSAGGRWTWADLEAGSADALERVLGEPVAAANAHRLPFSDGTFDRVVIVDVDVPGNSLAVLAAEAARVLTRYGVAIVHTAAPRAAPSVSVLRRWLARSPRQPQRPPEPPYSIVELQHALASASLEPLVFSEYSRVFTELAEVGFELAAAPDPESGNGAASPVASSRAGPVRRVVLPLLRAVSALDFLAARRPGHAIVIAAMKRG